MRMYSPQEEPGAPPRPVGKPSRLKKKRKKGTYAFKAHHAGRVGTTTGLDHSKLLSYSAKFRVSSNPWGELRMLVDTFGAADNCFSEFLLSF